MRNRIEVPQVPRTIVAAPERKLQPPKASAEYAAPFIARMKIMESWARPGNLDWANKLREREENGEDLLPVQRSAWREALNDGGTDKITY